MLCLITVIPRQKKKKKKNKNKNKRKEMGKLKNTKYEMLFLIFYSFIFGGLTFFH